MADIKHAWIIYATSCKKIILNNQIEFPSFEKTLVMATLKELLSDKLHKFRNTKKDTDWCWMNLYMINRLQLIEAKRM